MPVFALSGNAELFDIALDGVQGLCRRGMISELRLDELIKILQWFGLQLDTGLHISAMID